MITIGAWVAALGGICMLVPLYPQPTAEQRYNEWLNREEMDRRFSVFATPLSPAEKAEALADFRRTTHGTKWIAFALGGILAISGAGLRSTGRWLARKNGQSLSPS
jgi:hypothetical protein